MKYKQWPKRNRVKNYFRLPNEIFLLGLSPGALAVYSYLLCCENRNTYQCWPSYKTIGSAVRMSQNTVRVTACTPPCGPSAIRKVTKATAHRRHSRVKSVWPVCAIQ